MANRTNFTPKKVEKFLDSLRQQPNVTRAAEAAGVSRRAVYDRREADEEFKAAWDEAIEEGVDRLEEEMWRRAVEGVEKPVYQNGVLVGSEQRYSDGLAMFLAKAHRPKRFLERQQLLGDPENPLNVASAVQVYLPDNGRDKP